MNDRHMVPFLIFFFGGGGGVLRCIHKSVGSGHFLGFKVLNFNILGGFQKINIFLGMKILWIFFGVITKSDYI